MSEATILYVPKAENMGEGHFFLKSEPELFLGLPCCTIGWMATQLEASRDLKGPKARDIFDALEEKGVGALVWNDEKECFCVLSPTEISDSLPQELRPDLFRRYCEIYGVEYG